MTRPTRVLVGSPINKEYQSIRQAADALGVSHRTVRKWLDGGFATLIRMRIEMPYRKPTL